MIDQIKFPEWLSQITNSEAREIITRYYENSVKFGRDPEVQTAKLKSSVEKGAIDPELVAVSNIFQTGFITGEGDAEILNALRAEQINAENPTLMLSSSSKTFLVEGYTRLLKEKGLDLDKLLLAVSFRSIEEVASRIHDFKGEKTFGELFPSLTRNGNPLTAEELKKMQEDGELNINFDQALYCILTLSANGVLNWLKQLVMQSTGLSEEELALRLQEVAPAFRARVSDKILENMSNESSIIDYAKDKAAQSARLIFSLDSTSTQILDSITNNKCDFGFDFTNSELGQKLISDGCNIIEKTGSYGCVYWMKNIAEQGFPPHATFLTSVSVEMPDGRLKTFVYYELVEVPFSYEHAVDPDGMVNGWPDEDSDGYIRFFNELSSKIGSGFRARMSTEVSKYLQNSK